MSASSLFAIHQRWAQLATQQSNKQNILDSLYEISKLDATFYDVGHDRRVSTNCELSTFVSCSFEDSVELASLWTYPLIQAELIYSNTTTIRVPAISIPSSDGNPYYLIVHADFDNPYLSSEIGVMTIEASVGLLTQEILKKNALDQNLFTVNNNIVHDLLLGRFSSHEKLENALTSLGFSNDAQYQILLVRITLENEHSEKDMSAVRRAIRARIRALYPSIRFYVSNDRQLFVHSYKQEKDALDLSLIEQTLKKLEATPSIPNFTYLGVLSLTCDAYHIAQRNTEVMNTYKLFDESKWRNHCVRYENLGIYKLLMQIDDLNHINDYVDPRIMQLRHDNPDMIDTLFCLCDNNLNYQETAKQLFLHPKTIHYRVKRARQLVNLDVHNANDCLQIMLASRIFALADTTL